MAKENCEAADCQECAKRLETDLCTRSLRSLASTVQP